MKKRIVVFLLALVTVTSLFTVFSFASTTPTVTDLGDMFTPEEELKITAAAQSGFAELDCEIYILTSPFGDRLYESDFFRKYPNAADDCILLIFANNSDDNYNIYTYGTCDELLSQSDIDDILDAPEVYDAIKYSHKYADAAEAVVKLSSKAYSEAKAGAEAKENSPKRFLVPLIVGLIAGLISAGIFVACIVFSYKKKLHSEIYPLNRFAKLDLTKEEDNFAGTFVTTRIIKTSSSGGRSSGGRSGGHRGGR